MRRLQDAVVDWGKDARSELAKTMPLRNVSLGVDETFFAKMVLVGMDVSAGFILLEKYSERRDAQTWQKAVESGKEGLKLKCLASRRRSGKSFVLWSGIDLALRRSNIFAWSKCDHPGYGGCLGSKRGSCS